MVEPFIAFRAHVQLGAERPLVGLALGTLVDQRALHARERRGLGVALDEVLADLRAEIFQQIAQVAGHRVVAQQRVPGLQHIVQAQQQRHHTVPGGQRQERAAPAGLGLGKQATRQLPGHHAAQRPREQLRQRGLALLIRHGVTDPGHGQRDHRRRRHAGQQPARQQAVVARRQRAQQGGAGRCHAGPGEARLAQAGAAVPPRRQQGA